MYMLEIDTEEGKFSLISHPSHFSVSNIEKVGVAWSQGQYIPTPHFDIHQ